jgi:hypothetical protein
MLIHLLSQPDDGPVSIGPDVKPADREFLKATCAATVLLYQISFMSAFDAKRAAEGFEAITRDAVRNIYGICDEELPT